MPYTTESSSDPGTPFQAYQGERYDGRNADAPTFEAWRASVEAAGCRVIHVVRGGRLVAVAVSDRTSAFPLPQREE